MSAIVNCIVVASDSGSSANPHQQDKGRRKWSAGMAGYLMQDMYQTTKHVYPLTSISTRSMRPTSWSRMSRARFMLLICTKFS